MAIPTAISGPMRNPRREPSRVTRLQISRERHHEKIGERVRAT
ncbi:hypothetical protein L842_0811 [Mycobacterium intracellulare MIN_052511_1280]|nr:hypothetical protein L842_0811 [Mycobacterium intracellulare MIN_052511_1280]